MEEQKLGAANVIMAELEKMLDTEPYEKISVSQLCRRAGLSRKAFYSHFKDKDDVLRRIVERDIATPVTTLMPYLTLADLEEGGKLLVRHIYESLYQHRDFYVRATIQNHIAILRDVMREVLTATTVLVFRGDEVEPSEKYLYAAEFTSGANVAIMDRWFREGMVTPPEQLTDWVFEFSGSGNAALLNPRM